MLKFAFFLFVAALYLICSGCYDLFIQAGTSRQPTSVSVAELQTVVPRNRHLVVTGGRAAPEAAVRFYRTKWGAKVSGSEILFIPITDASATAAKNSMPFLLLRVTEDQLEEAKNGAKIDFKAVEGVRTTSLDLEDKARRRLVETYGQAAVDRMIILDYHGSVGIGTALGKVTGGVALAAALVGSFVFLQKPKVRTPAIAGSVPPPIPSGPTR